jgi:hypothetical protein
MNWRLQSFVAARDISIVPLMSVVQAAPPHRVLELFSGIGGWRMALQQVLSTMAPAAAHVVVFYFFHNPLSPTSHYFHDSHNALPSPFARLLSGRRSIARAVFGWKLWIRIGNVVKVPKFLAAIQN